MLIVLLSLQFKTLPNSFCCDQDKLLKYRFQTTLYKVYKVITFCCDQDKLLIKYRLHFRTVAACMVLARPRTVLTSSVNATELCHN